MIRGRSLGARVGVLGIPFDANSSFIRGPARAPGAIRRALSSEAGNTYSERGVEVWPSDAVVDHGDLRVPARAGVRAPIDAIERGVTEALTDTPQLLSLGGDHAVTYPVLRAVAKRWGPIALLQFDAHPDLYPDYEGNPYSHASPMARILEEGLVGRLVQVGIRSGTPEQSELARRHRVEVHPARSLPQLPRLRFSTPVYVSIDIDGIDPAFAPGVSHPEPGGLSVRHVLDVIAALRAPCIVGADVVELNPRRDPTGLTALVAAKLARELLARMITDSAGAMRQRRTGRR
jgi:agmatinase